MKLIRDEELGGILMIPLLSSWGITRCNVDACEEKPRTIMYEIDGAPAPAGICEKHYQEAKTKGCFDFHLVW